MPKKKIQQCWAKKKIEIPSPQMTDNTQANNVHKHSKMIKINK